MALSDDEAVLIKAMLVEILAQQICPMIERVVKAADYATGKAEAADARCARVEELLKAKATFEVGRLQEAVSISLNTMKPTFERMATTLAEAIRKNEALAKACIELGNQNKRLLFLKYADAGEMGKPS